jgi:hypothetical protein
MGGAAAPYQRSRFVECHHRASAERCNKQDSEPKKAPPPAHRCHGDLPPDQPPAPVQGSAARTCTEGRLKPFLLPPCRRLLALVRGFFADPCLRYISISIPGVDSLTRSLVSKSMLTARHETASSNPVSRRRAATAASFGRAQRLPTQSCQRDSRKCNQIETFQRRLADGMPKAALVTYRAGCPCRNTASWPRTTLRPSSTVRQQNRRQTMSAVTSLSGAADEVTLVGVHGEAQACLVRVVLDGHVERATRTLMADQGTAE